jgi:hypothetical protein
MRNPVRPGRDGPLWGGDRRPPGHPSIIARDRLKAAMARVAHGDTPESPSADVAKGDESATSPTQTSKAMVSREAIAPEPTLFTPKVTSKRILRQHVYGSARIAVKKSERLLPFKEDRNGRPLSACTEENIKIITDALRIGQSRHKACALANIDYRQTFLWWMRQSGEPYITVQQLVRKAEAEFERRHTMILNVKAEKQPQFSAWLLAHAPSTKSWKEYQQALIDAQGSTFNVAAILDQVQARRQLRAAQSVSPDPTTVIDHDPHPE